MWGVEDKYKFYNKKADYKKMRDWSDRICQDHGISVIENPQQRKKDYGLRKAEQRGQLTHSEMIRNDIDRAEKASLTTQDFVNVLKSMGYTIRVYGENGYPLKHPTITPPGGKKNFRFDSLGSGYDLGSILDRVNRNMRVVQPFEVPKKRYYSARMTRRPANKLTGLLALYFKYCCQLGIIKKHPNRYRKVSYQMREDIIKLDRYIAQAKLLTSNKIETGEDLEAYKGSVELRIGSLEAERTECRNMLRRTTGREDSPSDDELKEKIKQLSGELRQARKALEHCVEIAERSAQVRQNLLALRSDREDREGRFRSTVFSCHPSRDDYAR